MWRKTNCPAHNALRNAFLLGRIFNIHVFNFFLYLPSVAAYDALNVFQPTRISANWWWNKIHIISALVVHGSFLIYFFTKGQILTSEGHQRYLLWTLWSSRISAILCFQQRCDIPHPPSTPWGGGPHCHGFKTSHTKKSKFLYIGHWVLKCDSHYSYSSNHGSWFPEVSFLLNFKLLFTNYLIVHIMPEQHMAVLLPHFSSTLFYCVPSRMLQT